MGKSCTTTTCCSTNLEKEQTLPSNEKYKLVGRNSNNIEDIKTGNSLNTTQGLGKNILKSDRDLFNATLNFSDN